MAERYVVVLDAGSSRCRCFVFADGAKVVARAAADWTYRPSADGSPLARELDAPATWATFCRLIKRCLADANIGPAQVAAVSVTSQRQGVVFLSAEGDEIYAGPNLDLRAVFEGGAIDEEAGGRIYEITGHTPSFFFTPAKLRWFQLHRPDASVRIATVLTLADWLVWKLTGELVSEPTLAGEAGLLDIHDRSWCAGLLEELELPGNSHVPLVESGSVAGAVSADAARQVGVPEGTPVPVAGADTQCGLLGMGVAHEGQLGIVAGWSTPLQMVTSHPVLSPDAKTWAGCFLLGDRWVLESSAGDAGSAYNWLGKTLWDGTAEPFEEMDSMARNVSPGSDGTVAFLGPFRMNMNELGLRTGGFLFPVPLTLGEVGRERLVRSAMEATAYAIKANLEQIEDLAGLEATDIALGGGMTRSPTLVRVIVDVLGREVKVSSAPEVSAVGAYMCAATALGRYGSLIEAAEAAGETLRPMKPDPLSVAEYREHNERWARLVGGLQQL